MSFFYQHDFVTLIFLALFPRLTLLLASFATGGLLWWIGWFFCPHLLVAILSLSYWDTNPLLVIIAWCVAFGGTNTEAKAVSRKREMKKVTPA